MRFLLLKSLWFIPTRFECHFGFAEDWTGNSVQRQILVRIETLGIDAITRRRWRCTSWCTRWRCTSWCARRRASWCARRRTRRRARRRAPGRPPQGRRNHGLLTNAVELLQVERVDGEGEGDETPRIQFSVHWTSQEIVDVTAEVRKHADHIGEEVATHGDLGKKEERLNISATPANASLLGPGSFDPVTGATQEMRVT